MLWKLAVLLAAVIATVVFTAHFGRRRSPSAATRPSPPKNAMTSPATPSPTTPKDTLRARLAARSDYIVLIGMPPSAPARWVRTVRYTADEIETPEGRVAVNEVRAFAIGYPNGQILDMKQRGRLPLPPGLTFLNEGPQMGATVDPDEVARGLALVEVEHGPSRAKPRSRTDYRTSLTNRTSEPVRVLRFAAFVPSEGRHVLSTVTGAWFTADELIAWYGAPADGWIAPNATVADPDNYGGGAALWVYECETRSGRKFLTGRAVGFSP